MDHANPFPANAPGPCIVIGNVSLWVLGESRYRIVSPEGEEIVRGFDEARQRARELAGV
jgi:hypothetical protein